MILLSAYFLDRAGWWKRIQIASHLDRQGQMRLDAGFSASFAWGSKGFEFGRSVEFADFASSMVRFSKLVRRQGEKGLKARPDPGSGDLNGLLPQADLVGRGLDRERACLAPVDVVRAPRALQINDQFVIAAKVWRAGAEALVLTGRSGGGRCVLPDVDLAAGLWASEIPPSTCCGSALGVAGWTAGGEVAIAAVHDGHAIGFRDPVWEIPRPVDAETQCGGAVLGEVHTHAGRIEVIDLGEAHVWRPTLDLWPSEPVRTVVNGFRQVKLAARPDWSWVYRAACARALPATALVL